LQVQGICRVDLRYLLPQFVNVFSDGLHNARLAEPAGCIYQLRGEDRRRAGRPRRQKPYRRLNKTTGRPSDVSLNQLSSAYRSPFEVWTVRRQWRENPTEIVCLYMSKQNTEQRLTFSQKQDGAAPDCPIDGTGRR
jgi:hypothetical protein